MKLDSTQIKEIKELFFNVQTKEDFLQLLNQVKSLVFGDKAVPFEMNQLTWYGNPKLGGIRYREFKVKKKSGGERAIHAPVEGLKALQQTIAIILQCVFVPHIAAIGFVWNKSVVDNASLHTGQRFVFNLDLKDFFPSVNQPRVWKCLQLRPFNLNKEYSKQLGERKQNEVLDFLFGGEGKRKIGLKNGIVVELLGDKPFENNRLGIANLIAAISCTEMEVDRKNESGEWIKVKTSVLPQGAPTSPVITNIVCQRLDYLLSGLAKRFGLRYSRYADDLTFSSNHYVYKTDGEFQTELARIIIDQGFNIQESKTRLQGDGYRQEVTGLTVNKKVNVSKRYIKQLRMWLYYWERYGYEKASTFFIQSYVKDKSHVRPVTPGMSNVIDGKLNYLKMVKGNEDGTYLKLKERFDQLVGLTDPINEILAIWEKEGIEKAMQLYYLNNYN